jgi:ribosome-binding protein aMBF1 (putative translation factor)
MAGMQVVTHEFQLDSIAYLRKNIDVDMNNKQKTNDALEIMRRRIYDGHPERESDYEQTKTDMEVALKIYNLRKKAGLTQKELARLVNTTPSVISRLEDADYEGHSLAMLRRIAEALGKRVEIRFVSVKNSENPKVLSRRGESRRKI